MRRSVIGWSVAVGLLAVLTLAMFYPLIEHVFHGGPARWLEGDVAEEYWPDLVVLCRGLAEHHIPRWLPFEHGGTPFYADPQAAVYYPLNRAICAVAGPSPSIHWADARVVIQFLVAGICMTVFLSREGLALPSATVGGALFELSPYFRHNWELNLTGGFAYFPLVLLAVRAMFRRPTWLRGSLVGGAVALVVSAGSPPSTFFALLGAGALGCHDLVAAIRGKAPWRPLAGALLMAAAMTACLLPMMLVPTWELTRESVQAAHDYAAISDGGMPLQNLAGIILPALTDHHYVGLLTLALVPLAYVGARPFGLRWFFLGLAIFAALMIAGTHTPFHRLAYEIVPGVSLFRNPTRYSSLYGASLVILAAAGLDALVRGDVARPTLLRWLGGCLALALLAVLLGAVRGGTVLATGSLASLLVLWGRPLTAALPLAVGALCAVDSFPCLVDERHTRPGPLAEGRDTEDTLRSLDSHLDRDRTFDEFAIGMRSGSRYAQRDMRGYQDPLSIGRYEKVMGALETSPALLGSYNVRWVLYGPHYALGDWHHFVPDPARGSWAARRAPHVWELSSALPDAFWMDGAEVVADEDAALTRLAESAPAPAIVLESADARGLAASPPSTFVPCDSEVRGESMSITVDAPRPGLVVVNEAFYPGWVATVDGVPAPLRRANVFVRAIWVDAGKHRIEMEFRPWQPRFLEPLALGGLGLVLLGVILEVRRSHRA